MAEHRPPDDRVPAGGVPGGHRPDDAVVAALALDVALELARPPRVFPVPEGYPAGGVHDDLLEMADAVRATAAADRAGAGRSPAVHTAAVTHTSHPAPVVPLRPVSLMPVSLMPPAGPPRQVRRRSRRRQVAAVAAVAASAATLAIGADLALQAGGGTTGGGWAVPAATRLALAGDRVVLAPPGGGPSPADRVTAVTCTTDRHCLAVAHTDRHAVIAVSDDGGTTWQRRPAAATTAELSAILCATPEHCWAVGNGRSSGGNEAVVVGTDDGGRTWTTETVPAGVASLRSISCANVETCWAVGSAGGGAAAIVGTDDGGRTWTTEPVPAGMASLQSVSCPTVEACWVGGQAAGTAAVMATTDGGGNWEQQALPADGTAVAGAAVATSTRRPTATGPTATTISSITCTPAGSCWATATGGDAVTVLADAPGGWHVSARAPAGGIGRTGFVAAPGCRAGCPAPTGGSGNAALATIERGTAPDLRGRTAGGALTCPTAVECWVVQASGAGFTSTALDLGPGSAT